MLILKIELFTNLPIKKKYFFIVKCFRRNSSFYFDLTEWQTIKNTVSLKICLPLQLNSVQLFSSYIFHSLHTTQFFFCFTYEMNFINIYIYICFIIEITKFIVIFKLNFHINKNMKMCAFLFKLHFFSF